MYLDQQGEVIENETLIGGQGRCRAGTVAGMWAAHQRYGSLPWRELIQPAIELARQGFMPAPILVDEIRNLDWFGDKTSTSYFSQISAEQLFLQPELAMTLERIAVQGATDFYRGETARLIVEQMAKDDGLISLEDLAVMGCLARAASGPVAQLSGIILAPAEFRRFRCHSAVKMKDALASHFEGVATIPAVCASGGRDEAGFDRGEYLGDSILSTLILRL